MQGGGRIKSYLIKLFNEECCRCTSSQEKCHRKSWITFHLRLVKSHVFLSLSFSTYSRVDGQNKKIPDSNNFLRKNPGRGKKCRNGISLTMHESVSLSLGMNAIKREISLNVDRFSFESEAKEGDSLDTTCLNIIYHGDNLKKGKNWQQVVRAVWNTLIIIWNSSDRWTWQSKLHCSGYNQSLWGKCFRKVRIIS